MDLTWPSYNTSPLYTNELALSRFLYQLFKTVIMEKCPTEIIQEIMFCLPDFESLDSIILTCRGFHAAFKNKEASILRNILERVIPPTLWFDAEMARLSSQITGDDWTTRSLLLQQYLARDLQSFASTFRPSLRQCKGLATFYEIMENWTDDFVDDTLGSVSIHGYPLSPPLDAVPISYAERIRIQRCFYRFDIFCGVFCTAYPSAERQGEELLAQYLTHFTPWEHEQFACIRDYLRSALRLGMYSTISSISPNHAKTGSDQHAGNNTPMQPVLVDYHLPRGLAHILAVLEGEIITASAAASLIISSSAYRASRVLGEHLRWAVPDDITLVGDLFADISEEGERELINQEWSPSGDHGAVAVWRQAYKMEQVMSYVDSPRQEALRAWGYVFWDWTRLNALGVFKLQWDSHVQLWV